MPLYLGNEKIKNLSIGAKNIGVSEAGLNAETTTDFEGLIKGKDGKVAQAVPGVDYVAPDALNDLGTLATKDKVDTTDLTDALKKKIEDAGNITLPEGIVQNNITNTFIANGKIVMDSSYVPSGDNDLADKKYVDKQVKSATPAFSNGPILFEESGTFNPSNYNLAVGDQVQVVCIGGGGGGGSGNTSGSAAGGTSGDYGCGGNGGAPSSYDNNKSYWYGQGGGGGSGYLTKKIITLDSTSSISITIGKGGTSNADGASTSFGTYLAADGGKAGSSGKSTGSYNEIYDSAAGSPGVGGHSGSGRSGGAGWTVKSYTIQDSSGTLSKGSGAVFIWY